MVKCNPANKQAGEHDEDPTVQEMLNNYEEYKNRTEISTSKFSDEVQERLPDQAEIVEGDLTVPSPKRESESDGQPINFSLTETRREAIKALGENPDKSQVQISEDLGVSDTLVGYAKRAFEFLLDDPVLFDAFVITGRTSYSPESEEDSERDEYDGTPWSDRSHTEIVNEHFGESESDDVEETLADVAESDDEDDSPEPCGTTMTDAYSESQDSADTSDSHAIVRKSQITKADGFSAEQLSKVLNGLYADREEELATEILRELMEE